MRKQFQDQTQHSPIEFVTGRVKPVDSIKEKMIRRHVQEDRLEQDMQDIAGLRIMCQFVEDIYKVVDLLRQRSDMTILEERDYVTNVKPSGYRSYHIVIEYSVQLITGEKRILAPQETHLDIYNLRNVLPLPKSSLQGFAPEFQLIFFFLQ